MPSSPATPAPDSPNTPVVGREVQLARLLGSCTALPHGSRTLLLSAEAGGGKTTVVRALTRRLSASDLPFPIQHVVGECIPLGDEGLPFVPISSILRQLFERYGVERMTAWAGPGLDTFGLLVPTLVPQRAVAESDVLTDGGMDAEATQPGSTQPGSAPATERLRLFEAVGRVLEGAAAEAPLVVVVEDLHWSDEATRDLLGYLVRSLGPAPVGLVLTYRTDEVHRHHPLRPYLAELSRASAVERIELPRLTRAEVAELLQTTSGHPVDPDRVDLVHERTDGLPYFVAELGSALAQGCEDLPDNLREVLMVRVTPLSEPTQRLVRLMTTGGNTMSHALLAAVVGDQPDLDDLLREAVDAGILHTADHGYGFRHALLREALHGDLLPGEHARTHAQFAEALLAHPELAQNRLDSELAHHWSAAGEQQLAFVAALDAARTSTSPYEQIRMYERVLELWDRVDRTAAELGRADVLEAVAQACRRVSASSRGLPYIHAALEETDADTHPLDASRRLVVKAALQGLLAELGVGATDDSIATVRLAVDLTEPHRDSLERVAALEAAATQLMLAGQFEEAYTMATRAVAAAEARGERHLLASAHNTRGCTQVQLGHEDEGLAEVRDSRALAEGDVYLELRYHVNLSDALVVAGHYREAADLALAGIDRARSYGIARAAGAMVSGNAAEALLELGDFTRAAEVIRASLDLLPVGHHRLHLRMLQAWLDVWRGHYDEARQGMHGQGQQSTPAGRLPQYQFLWRRAMADLAWWHAEPGTGWEVLVPLLSRLDRYGSGRRAQVLPLAARAARDPAAPPGAIAEVRALLEASVPTVAVAEVFTPLTHAELDDTAETWRVAVTALESCPVSPAYLIPYGRYRLATHLLEVRDRAGAAAELERAAAEAAEIGLEPLRQRIATLQRRAGVLVAAGPAAGAGAVSLTSREHEVLGLVAQGRSNAEIGRTLYISTKTVSVHVSNIIAKLGASSRGDAAARARRAGLIT